MLAAAIMLAALLAGIRWPGVLLAGCLFTYQTGSLSGFERLGEAYVAAAALVSLTRFVHKRHSVRLRALDAWLFAVAAWAAISTTWAPLPDSEDAQRLLLSIGGIYAVARFVTHDPNKLAAEFLIGCTAIGGAMALLLASLDASATRQVGRLAVGEASAVGLAQPLPFVATAAVLLFLLSRRARFATLAALCLAVTAYASILSGTRSVFFASAVALAVALPMIVRRSPLRAGGFLAISAAIVTIAAPLFFSEQIEPAIERLAMNFTDGRLDLSDASSSMRLDAYWLAIDMFLEKPIIGYGHGSFGTLSPLDYPHNMFLEAAAGTGLVGVVLTLGWMIALGAGLLGIHRQHPFAGLVFLTMVIVAFVQMQVSFALFMARPLFALTALTAAYAPNHHSRLPNQRPRRRAVSKKRKHNSCCRWRAENGDGVC